MYSFTQCDEIHAIALYTNMHVVINYNSIAVINYNSVVINYNSIVIIITIN